MARIVFTERATADAIGIYTDLNAKAGLHTVAKFRALFRKLYDRLADLPDSGALRSGLGQNIRIGVVPPYIVIYRHEDTDGIVYVLRIIHGRRKITAKMIFD
jgi:plasmid stabilization system protein ParE